MKLENKINILYHLLRSRVKRIPFKLNFAVTNKCNGHCIGCNVWSSSSPGNELTTEEIEKFFRRLSYGLIWISLTGGEPFLREDFVEIVASASRNIKSLSIISIPTNGLSTDLILRKLRAILKLNRPLVYLSVSIDGPEGIHNELRGDVHAFEQAWETYIKARELLKGNRNFLVNIETTISMRNVTHLPSFLKKLISEGHSPFVTFFNTGFLYKNTGISDMSFKTLTPELEETLRIVSANLSWLRGEDLIKRIYMYGIKSFLQQKRFLSCVSLKSSFALDCQGDVLPCLMWGKILGNIRDYDYDVTKILNSAQAYDILRMVQEGKCPGCWTPCEAFQAIIDPFNYLLR